MYTESHHFSYVGPAPDTDIVLSLPTQDVLVENAGGMLYQRDDGAVGYALLQITGFRTREHAPPDDSAVQYLNASQWSVPESCHPFVRRLRSWPLTLAVSGDDERRLLTLPAFLTEGAVSCTVGPIAMALYDFHVEVPSTRHVLALHDAVRDTHPRMTGVQGNDLERIVDLANAAYLALRECGMHDASAPQRF